MQILNSGMGTIYGVSFYDNNLKVLSDIGITNHKMFSYDFEQLKCSQAEYMQHLTFSDSGFAAIMLDKVVAVKHKPDNSMFKLTFRTGRGLNDLRVYLPEMLDIFGTISEGSATHLVSMALNSGMGFETFVPGDVSLVFAIRLEYFDTYTELDVGDGLVFKFEGSVGSLNLAFTTFDSFVGNLTPLGYKHIGSGVYKR